MDILQCSTLMNDKAITALVEGSDQTAIDIFTATLDMLPTLKLSDSFPRSRTGRQIHVYPSELARQNHDTVRALLETASVGDKQIFERQHRLNRHLADWGVQRKDYLSASASVVGVRLSEGHGSKSSSGCALFDMAFRFGGEQGDYVSVVELSVVLVYNCALALHRAGVLIPNESALRHALAGYHRAHGLLEQIDLSEQPQWITLTAAIYYNMSQIFGALSHLREASHMRRNLKQVLSWPCAIKSMDKRSYSFLQESLSGAEMGNCKLAPAA